MMVSMALYAFQRDEKPYLYLYTQLKFNWTTEIYSNFKTYQSGAFVLVMLIAVPIMNKVFKWKDTTIVILGACAHSLGRVFFGLATGTWMMYLGASVAALGIKSIAIIRIHYYKYLLSLEAQLLHRLYVPSHRSLFRLKNVERSSHCCLFATMQFHC